MHKTCIQTHIPIRTLEKHQNRIQEKVVSTREQWWLSFGAQ